MDLDTLIERGSAIINAADSKSPKVMIWKNDVRQFISSTFGSDYVKMLRKIETSGMRMMRSQAEIEAAFRERTQRIVDFLNELKDIEPKIDKEDTASTSAGSGDAIKDAVIQYLYEEQRENPLRSIGWSRYEIMNELNDNGHEESDVAFAIDFLDDEGYFKSTTSDKVKYHRLSSKALQQLLPPSAYARKKGESLPRILNNGGIVIVGDNYGDINLADRTSLIEKIETIEAKVLESSDLDDVAKIDARESAETIKSQLRRKTPDFSIINNAWVAFQDIAIAQTFSESVKEVELLLEKIAKA